MSGYSPPQSLCHDTVCDCGFSMWRDKKFIKQKEEEKIEKEKKGIKEHHLGLINISFPTCFILYNQVC